MSRKNSPFTITPLLDEDFDDEEIIFNSTLKGHRVRPVSPRVPTTNLLEDVASISQGYIIGQE